MKSFQKILGLFVVFIMFSFNTEYLFSVDNVTLSIERNHIVKLKIDSINDSSLKIIEINKIIGEYKGVTELSPDGIRIVSRNSPSITKWESVDGNFQIKVTKKDLKGKVLSVDKNVFEVK